MDTARIRGFDGLAGALDIDRFGARQPADRAVLDDFGNLAIGNPASIISTFISSSARAMRIFSSRVMDAPGLCSPSRSVVSKMINLSLLMAISYV
jgi:hypothetical protein